MKMMNGCHSELYPHYITETTLLKDANNLVAKSDRDLNFFISLGCSAAYEIFF